MIAPSHAGDGGARLWRAGALVVAGLVMLPLVAIVWVALLPGENIWPHLVATVLPRYIQNTGILMLGNGIVVLVVGVATAWLVAVCRFPGRAIFEWALLLPLAAPAYIVAFVYTELLEYAGPLQRLLRATFGWSSPADYWFPEIRSHGGAIFVMSMVLYPYVYLLARAAFLEQSTGALEAARTLGRGPWRSFFAVALPMARPAIAAGTALALMETLADFGTVDFFAINTLSRGIFNVWLNMGNIAGGAQVALVMLGVVVVLLWLERHGRRHRRFHRTGTRTPPPVTWPLRGPAAAAAFVVCLLPVVLGFVVPAVVLVDNAVRYFDISWSADFGRHVRASLLLAAGAAAITVAVAAFLAWASRVARSPAVQWASRTASLGYAVPGAVLAIGVLVPFAAFDNAVDALAREHLGVSTGLMLSGTIFALLFAYMVRFLAVAYGALETALGRIPPSLDMAARTLGRGPAGSFMRVQLPLMRPSLFAAATIVFVDTMKELPATLLLRPFNFDTLATAVYQNASLERLEHASLASLTIVVAGVVPVVLLSRAITRGRTAGPTAGPALVAPSPGGR
ncbi:MAG: ABC transporter permease [Alphaproteobacteria bacterium]